MRTQAFISSQLCCAFHCLRKALLLCTLSRTVWRGWWAGPSGGCSMDNPGRPLHLHITSMNTHPEETLQFSDRGKEVAPRLYEFSINSQNNTLSRQRSLSVQSEMIKHGQHKLASVGVFADWGFRSCLRWYFGDPFEHHMCMPNAAITLWPQMLFSFTSWVL